MAMNTTTAVASSRRPARLVARDVLGLFKLRIGVMIMVTALVGWVVTPGTALSAGQVLVLALSVLIASGSAGAYNQYYEHDVDHLMARTPRCATRRRGCCRSAACWSVRWRRLGWHSMRRRRCSCSSARSSTPSSTRCG